jgi:hypothetical protein
MLRALEVGEGIDDVPGLEGPVPFPDADLRQYASRHESADGLVGLREAAADQLGAASRTEAAAIAYREGA